MKLLKKRRKKKKNRADERKIDGAALFLGEIGGIGELRNYFDAASRNDADSVRNPPDINNAGLNRGRRDDGSRRGRCGNCGRRDASSRRDLRA